MQQKHKKSFAEGNFIEYKKLLSAVIASLFSLSLVHFRFDIIFVRALNTFKSHTLALSLSPLDTNSFERDAFGSPTTQKKVALETLVKKREFSFSTCQLSESVALFELAKKKERRRKIFLKIF